MQPPSNLYEYGALVAVIGILLKVLIDFAQGRVKREDGVCSLHVESKMADVLAKLDKVIEAQVRIMNGIDDIHDREPRWTQLLERLADISNNMVDILKTLSIEVHDTRRDVQELRRAS